MSPSSPALFLGLALTAFTAFAAPATAAASAAAPRASQAAPSADALGPALELPELSDAQVRAFQDAMSTASEAVSANRPDRAVRAYRKAAAIHSGNESLWYNLACALALSGQQSEALDALRRAGEAGWADASWPAQDSDLASLQDLPAFKEWLASVEAAPKTPSAALALGPLASTPEAITAAIEQATKAFDRVRPVLGSTAMMREVARMSEWRVASWDGIAAGLEGEARAEAQMEALRSLTRKDYWPKNPDLAAQAEQRAIDFTQQNPASPLAATADLIAALAESQRLQAAAAAAEDEQARERASTEAGHALERRLLVLAATRDDSPAVRAALAKLLGQSQDARARQALYARLARLVPDEAERKELVMADSRGAWFALEGLPAFEAKTLDGQVITPAALKGRVVMLDFWATWCGPCKAELPNVKEAYARFKGDGFEIIGISLDRDKEGDPTKFKEWCQSNDIAWPQVFDGKHWEAALAKQFGVRSIPFPLLVGRDGRVVASDEQLRGDQLMSSIEAALLRGASGL